jgi:hypothetical protein
MPELLKIDELPYALRVNGILVESVLLRRANDSADVFQVVITDPQIGLFALNDAFEFEVCEEGAPWRSITLAQLTKGLTKSTESLQVEDIPKASEMAERRLFDRLDDIDVPHRESLRLGQLTGQVDCISRVQKALYQARIPHMMAGAVCVVPSALKARMCLMRAGFRKSTIAPTALIEPLSGCTIQLLERGT